jgi:elongation factor Ts
MAITAADVNKLRQMTGAGMMDCKNALVEANGNTEEAIDILRKKGQKIAAKRSDRDANEGFVYAMTTADHSFGAMIMLNCETDFVAKTDDFVNFGKAVTEIAIAQKPKTVEELLACSINGVTIEAASVELTGKTGEKVQINHYEFIDGGFVSSYNHNGNRLATIVGFNKNATNLETVGHEIAMQVAAMSPVAVDQASVSQATIDHEMEIARETTRQEGKPEDMVEKISQGKLNKFLKENTLVNQEFIRDNKKTVGQYMKETASDLVCVGFKRLQLGA